MFTSPTAMRVHEDFDPIVVFDEIDSFDGFDAAEDEMDAPSDWDAGSVNFDPYI